MIPAIFGLSGPVLTAAEHSFFRASRPMGFILFGRNIVDPDQLRALTDALRSMSGRADLPILVDQEGGRVARLKPPHWPELPAARSFGALWQVAPATAMMAARANAEALGAICAGAGINAPCLPVLDLDLPGAHPAMIADRSFGSDPIAVAALGRAVLDGLADAGVAGVMKHAPGYGRAAVDSHHALPVVGAGEDALAADLEPFAALASRAPMAMTAHALFTAWDDDAPATLSGKIVGPIIRDRIGFDGLLMTDDIAMGALDGPMASRATAALAAGCDVVLHCSAELAEMQAIADVLPTSTSAALHRLERAMAGVRASDAVSATTRWKAALAKADALVASVTA
jgi:beta-N-acetylhexosaminidase